VFGDRYNNASFALADGANFNFPTAGPVQGINPTSLPGTGSGYQVVSGGTYRVEFSHIAPTTSGHVAIAVLTPPASVGTPAAGGTFDVYPTSQDTHSMLLTLNPGDIVGAKNVSGASLTFSHSVPVNAAAVSVRLQIMKIS
jgi:hypothetical protein